MNIHGIPEPYSSALLNGKTVQAASSTHTYTCKRERGETSIIRTPHDIATNINARSCYAVDVPAWATDWKIL